MNQRMLIAIGTVWGIVALIIGAGIAHAFLASAEKPNQAEAPLSSAEREVVTIREQAEIIAQTEDPTETTSTPPPITTTVIFERGSCPQSENPQAPNYQHPVDKETSVGEYVPGFLVEVQDHLPTKDDRIICLDETTALYTRDMFDAAEAEGLEMVITSGYRSHQTQAMLRKNSLAKYGDLEHDRVAEAGHSEHQLGTAIDLASAGNGFVSAGASFAKTEEYQWMLDHAADYGFRLSYPDGQQDETGYIFEPWHWRFVGFE